MMTATDRLDAVLDDAQDRGLIGPGPVASHRLHAEAFLALVPGGVHTAADLGTGGGLPGLVLAAMLPAVTWTFIESSVTRARFLTEAVATLELSAQVRTERAETVGRGEGRASFDLVTARSFGPPAVVAECAAPLLVPGGRLIVSEPPEADTAVRWPQEGVEALGFGPPHPVAGPPRFVVLELVAPCPGEVPRKVGQPAKRPRF